MLCEQQRTGSDNVKRWSTRGVERRSDVLCTNAMANANCNMDECLPSQHIFSATCLLGFLLLLRRVRGKLMMMMLEVVMMGVPRPASPCSLRQLVSKVQIAIHQFKTNCLHAGAQNTILGTSSVCHGTTLQPFPVSTCNNRTFSAIFFCRAPPVPLKPCSSSSKKLVFTS